MQRELALQADADLVAAVCGPTNGEDLQDWRAHWLAVLESRAQRSLITRERRAQLQLQLAAAPPIGAQPVARFYQESVAPYLRGQLEPSAAALAYPETAAIAFIEQRDAAPKALQPMLSELEQICAENPNEYYKDRWIGLPKADRPDF